MTNSRPDGPSAPQQTPGDRWSRRPRRSRSDRKVAGVAGGIGRYLGVDPTLIRVAFVVLTIFGGFGIGLYALGWLLLPGDEDDVSAGEALIGRGRSAVSPMLAVILAIIAFGSLFSMFAWRFHMWPLIGIAVVVLIMMRRGRGRWTGQGRQGSGWQGSGWQGSGWQGSGWQGSGWQASGWQGSGQQGSGWGQAGTATDAQSSSRAGSPFSEPAFWDAETGRSGGHAGPEPTTAGPSPAGPSTAGTRPSATPPSPADPLDPLAGRTPPAWDPLGVAPFAWDLPDPEPLPAPTEAPQSDPRVGSRVTLGLTLIAGGVAAAGVLAGWWALSWGQVTGIALAVLAAGLLIGSLRSRVRGLIGPGIFLALVTLALTVTGVRGTDAIGQQTWTPQSTADLQSQYVLNAGEGTLDLTQMTLPPGGTVGVSVDVRTGQATVIVPEGVNVNAHCSANVGQVDCLGTTGHGVRPSVTATQTGAAGSGTIDVTVHAGAGNLEVRHG